jgi:hypothetical protein
MLVQEVFLTVSRAKIKKFNKELLVESLSLY